MERYNSSVKQPRLLDVPPATEDIVNSKTNQRSCSGYLFAVAEETTHQILPSKGVAACADARTAPERLQDQPTL
jgi:hypothetical protein